MPVVLDAAGRKLSKRDLAHPIDPLHPLPALLQAWAFLGQGYRRGDALGTCRVAIASVRSRVVPAQR